MLEYQYLTSNIHYLSTTTTSFIKTFISHSKQLFNTPDIITPTYIFKSTESRLHNYAAKLKFCLSKLRHLAQHYALSINLLNFYAYWNLKKKKIQPFFKNDLYYLFNTSFSKQLFLEAHPHSRTLALKKNLLNN